MNINAQFEDIVIKQDRESGLIAIIAIHNTKNGPSLGGCRFVSYPSIDAALADAMRLAEAMTYKSAMAGLPLGGGKSVIISHDGIPDRKKLFTVFGDMVNQVGGKYITASDSGTNEDDMKIIATRTKYVTSINKSSELVDDTAAMTAAGMIRALEAVVQFRLKQNHFNNLHIAIQGIGSVGYLLAKILLERGARLTISDKNTELMHARAKELGVATVDPTNIASIECDIFAPCALGGILNVETIPNLHTPIICGAANNQLATPEDGYALYEKGIVYVPDYVANAGGVICACAQAGVISKEVAKEKVENIYNSVLEVLNTSVEMKLPTNIVANKIAEKRFL